MFRSLLFLLSCAIAQAALGGSVTLQVQKQDGTPLDNAVFFVRASELPPPVAPVKGKKPAKPVKAEDEDQEGDPVIFQQGQEFHPFILAVKKGTVVKFQNSDEVKHNIYSFSSEQKFNFPLHGKGEVLSTKPLDKPGPVQLGCNIHDWMSAYIYVVDSHVFAVSGRDGKAVLEGLPDKSVKISVWHPYLKDQKTIPEISYKPGDKPAALKLELRKVFKAKRESY